MRGPFSRLTDSWVPPDPRRSSQRASKPPVIDAVNNRSAAELAVFALAAVLGLAVFSTVLDQVLADHHDTVMAALIGLMAGSLRVLWPWPDGTDTADLARPDDWAVPILLCLLGLAAVFTFAWTAGRSSALRSTT